MDEQASTTKRNLGYSAISLLLGAVLSVFLGATIPLLVTKVFGPTLPWYETIASYGLFVLIFACLAWIIYWVLLLDQSIKEVKEIAGIRVRYVGTQEEVFRHAKEYILKANEEILILNSFINERSREMITSKDENDYYISLIDHAKNHHVKYDRILQVTEEQFHQKPIEVLTGNIGYLRHFHMMLKEREANSEVARKVSLKYVLAKRLTTFVLIDGKYLIWQINQFPEAGKVDNLQMQGAFFIEDFTGLQIISEFKIIWEEILRGALYPVEKDMLPKIVLILGHFSEERKKVLNALSDELKTLNYAPVIYDPAKQGNYDITETVRTARLAQFIIADLTDLKGIPQMLQDIVNDSDLRKIPVKLLLLAAQKDPASVAGFIKSHPRVLPIFRYNSQTSLITSLNNEIIDPAEQKAKELAQP